MLDIDIQIGCTGLANSQWGALFFPDDIPEDWMFDYYCNEFSTLLLEKPDRTELNNLLEEGLDEDFKLMLLADKQAYTDLSDNNIDYINSFVLLNDPLQLKKTESLNHQRVYYCNDEAQLQPMQLKELLDLCVADYSQDQQNNSDDNRMLYLFFSDKIHAIENARNMKMLVQLL